TEHGVVARAGVDHARLLEPLAAQRLGREYDRVVAAQAGDQDHLDLGGVVRRVRAGDGDPALLLDDPDEVGSLRASNHQVAIAQARRDSRDSQVSLSQALDLELVTGAVLRSHDGLPWSVCCCDGATAFTRY